MAENPERLGAIAARHATVADKIRALAGAGVARADIARFLGKRYQHVRNVLEDDAQSRPQSVADQSGGGYVLGKADLSGVREGPRPFDRDDDAIYIERRSATAFWLEVKPDGSLPLSKEIADVLGAEPGQKVFAKIRDGRLTLMSADAAMAEAQAIVCKYIPPEVDLAGSLIADRRAEAEREEAGD
jgi:hypothetical protein